ncbi:MAG: DUF2437 domain-containing protein [Myxococcales bacterium]|nr:DUF2437 domain-containing protein [Myxococcales bacterium]
MGSDGKRPSVGRGRRLWYTRAVRYVRLLVAGAVRHGVLREDTVCLLDGDPVAGPASATGHEFPSEGARLLVPCTPTKILGVGLNYRAHARETGKAVPDEPLLFLKPPSALTPQGAPIFRPRGYQRTDYEGELCAVIGRRARRVSEADALAHVFGFTILNDVTVRDLQKKDGQFTRAKGFDSFAPVGPCIATDLDPQALRIRTRVNGELKQDSSTEDMVFSVARLIAFASRVMTLEPGDLFTTGTPHGHGPLSPGDRVEIAIEGIGVLSNPVLEAPHED